MEVVYLEFTQLLAAPSLDDGAVRKAYFVYFEGSHFYDRTQRLRKRAGQLILHNHDVWFDGDILYVGDSDGTSAFFPGVTTKYLIADATEPERPKKRWEFPHLDAAGFYAPERMTELQQWLSVESMVLRYLKQSDSTIVEEAGENLRLTVVVPDRFLVGAREMDIEWLRKTLDPRLSSPDLIAKEIEMYERARKLKPEQTVTFLLDPKHGYGVAEREETNAEGQRTLRVTSEDWKYYESAGIWLPLGASALYT